MGRPYGSKNGEKKKTTRETNYILYDLRKPGSAIEKMCGSKIPRKPRSPSYKICIDGQIFNTMVQACEVLNISYQLLRNRLHDSDYMNYLKVGINPTEYKSNRKIRKQKEVVIDGVVYKNRNVASKETGVSYTLICNRVMADKWPTWHYR